MAKMEKKRKKCHKGRDNGRHSNICTLTLIATLDAIDEVTARHAEPTSSTYNLIQPLLLGHPPNRYIEFERILRTI